MVPLKVFIDYKNWKGVVGIRHITPKGIHFGKTEYHPEEQWLLDAYDHDKEDFRTFAMNDILKWGVK
jgi:predicted DNA-binding transcriptional regulator YafY